jgi:hypothetical protein
MSGTDTERTPDGERAFQRTMREDLIAGVEAIAGRKVRAFLSANHVEPDLATESFLLDGFCAQAFAAARGIVPVLGSRPSCVAWSAAWSSVSRYGAR